MMGLIEVAAVPGDELAEVVGGTIGRRAPTAIGELVPLEAPELIGSGWLGGGAAMGGWGPAVNTTPVPLRGTVCGLPKALSKRMRAPVRVPGPSGVKITARVQLAPGPTVAPQVLV